MIQGPNVKRLISIRMATEAVPRGGGLQSAIDFLTDPKKMIAGARAATEWVEDAIRVIRLAAPPNPWRDASDEDIAAHLMQQIDERRQQLRTQRSGNHG